jgi:hypothetical protein
MAKLQLILGHENSPQGQPFLASQSAGLDMGSDTGFPVAVDTAGHRFRLALGDSEIGYRKHQRVKIDEALEDRARRAASFFGDLHRRRHFRIATEQSKVGLDD